MDALLEELHHISDSVPVQQDGSVLWHCIPRPNQPGRQTEAPECPQTHRTPQPKSHWVLVRFERPSFAFPMTEAQVSNSHRSVPMDQRGKVCLKQCLVAVQSGLLLQLLLR